MISRTLSTDGTEQDQVLFYEGNKNTCIDQSSCLDNEVCVKPGDGTDVGTCQCPLGFRRNIAGKLVSYCIIYMIGPNML